MPSYKIPPSDLYASHNLDLRALQDTLRSSSSLARMCEEHGFTYRTPGDHPVQQLHDWISDQLAELDTLRKTDDKPTISRLLTVARAYGFYPFETTADTLVAFFEEKLQDYAELKQALEKIGIYK